MLYIVSYDVSDDARRRRVHEALKDFGRRVQYSVFECGLDGKALEDVRARIEVEIDPATDSCRIYRVCEACAAEVAVIGRGDRYSEPDFFII